MIPLHDINEDKISRLDSLIEQSGHIAIATHMRPDGDAVGSTVAMLQYLTCKRGRDARIVLSDRYPEPISFMVPEDLRERIYVFEEDAEQAGAYISSCDLILCLDCAGFVRTGVAQEALSASMVQKVLIDHHLNPDRQEFGLIFSDTQVSSASEMVFHIIRNMPDMDGSVKSLPMTALSALMAGLTTDTNNFANSVFPTTWEMASALLDAGVDRDGILEHIYNEYRENRVRLMGHMLKDRMVITSFGVAYIVLDRETAQEYDIRDGELEGFVNIPLSIREVGMSLFLREDDGFFRVSIRSMRGISANRCAQLYFHGGGHEQAAGGRIYIGSDIRDRSCAAAFIEAKTKEFFCK